jgi:pilus assembly protein Flp/PilA
MSKVMEFLRNESGATAIEYGLIAAGISVAIITVVKSVGTGLNDTFTRCRVHSSKRQSAADRARLRVRWLHAGGRLAMPAGGLLKGIDAKRTVRSAILGLLAGCGPPHRCTVGAM